MTPTAHGNLQVKSESSLSNQEKNTCDFCIENNTHSVKKNNRIDNPVPVPVFRESCTMQFEIGQRRPSRVPNM